MSGTAPAVLELDASGPWPRGPVQRNSHLLFGSVPVNRTRAPLKLPSLVAAAKRPCGRSSMTRLSLSEPSLLAPSEEALFDGFSCARRSSVLHKRPPPPPSPSKSSTLQPCKNCQPPRSREQQLQSSRPAFLHFSQAIQPGVRPPPRRRHSHNPALSSEMLSAAQRRNSSSSQEEPLSVVGRMCVLSFSQRPPPLPPAAAPPSRSQIHVFLPSEVEGEEADSESVDEGFMDELDSKMSSLKLQKGSAQTLTNHS